MGRQDEPPRPNESVHMPGAGKRTRRWLRAKIDDLEARLAQLEARIGIEKEKQKMSASE